MAEDYLQTCNMNERTNEEKLRDKTKELELDILDLQNINAESVDNLIMANLHRADMQTKLDELELSIGAVMKCYYEDATEPAMTMNIEHLDTVATRIFTR